MLTDKDAPHLINSQTADSGASAILRGRLKRAFEPNDGDQHDKSTTQLSETLHRENSTHHCSSPFGSSKSGFQSVIAFG